MKYIHGSAYIMALILSTQNAFAHDPSMHATQAKDVAPNCAAMETMDMSKMDMNDPVLQAMHLKCMGSKKDTGMSKDSTNSVMSNDMPTSPPTAEHGGH
jgi:translation elongation factor EF-Ts